MRLTGEWELGPEEVAGLFQAKGWCYHTERGLIIPNGPEIERRLAKLVEEAMKAGRDEVQGGRLMVWKDPDLPYSYDVWLNLGYVWDDEALGEGPEEAVA